MDPVLEQLKAGVRQFRSDVYPERAQMYARAATETQRPHTLFIACADSSVDPIEILQAGTGGTPSFVTQSGDVTMATGGATTINKLQNNTLTLSGVSTGQFIRYNGTAFVNAALTASDIPDLSSSYIANQTSQQTSANFNIQARTGSVAMKVQV